MDYCFILGSICTKQGILYKYTWISIFDHDFFNSIQVVIIVCFCKKKNVNWMCVTDTDLFATKSWKRSEVIGSIMMWASPPCTVLIFSQSTGDKFPVTGWSHDPPRLSLASPFLDIHLQTSLGMRRDPKQSPVEDKLHDWVGWGGERAHSRTQLSHLVNGKGPQTNLRETTL